MKPLIDFESSQSRESSMDRVAGALAARILCNADCSSVAAIDSVDSFLVAKDAGGTPAGRGHKNESTDPKFALLSTLPFQLSPVEVPPQDAPTLRGLSG